MENKERIRFRKLLKKNGFVKSSTSENKDLMEFVKNELEQIDKIIIVYFYEVVEAYFDTDDYVILTIEQFSQLYKKLYNREFAM